MSNEATFEAGIASLEKTNATPLVVLKRASDLIGVNLEDNIRLCSHELRYRDEATSNGLKEQWLLRWLLRKLSPSSSKPNNNESGPAEDSFSLATQSWSLLLHLLCSIPNELCLEILHERKFFQTLEHIIRAANGCTKAGEQSESQSPSLLDTKTATDGPPSKKRKLDVHKSVSISDNVEDGDLVWIMLQTACRCLVLANSPKDLGRPQMCRMASSWTSNWNERASLTGALLQTIGSLIRTSPQQEEFHVLCAITTTVVQSWTASSTDSRGHMGDAHRAFSSHCLMPALVILQLLRDQAIDFEHTRPVTRALERLVAVHIAMPGRTLFNERYARKWRAIGDIFLYDNINGFLNDFQKIIIDVDNARLQIQQSNMPEARLDLLNLVFDIAIRSMPTNDLQKRQSEQPWLDSLFLSLIHTLWNEMPRISSPEVPKQAVLSYPESSDFQTVITPLEGVVDIALHRRLRPSLPVLGYVMSAVLSLDDQPPAWSVIAKLVELDVNILLPNTGLLTSQSFLAKVASRIEECTVSNDIYLNILQNILLPVMRGFARSRSLDGFIYFWRAGLENAIRLRVSSQSDPSKTPTVLLWDDDEVFDEFKTLVELFAPPSMSQRLLEQSLEPMGNLSTKVGSTAVEFANLAIFCASLQASMKRADHVHLNSEHIASLRRAVVAALHRQSDYQAQRWRLWAVLRLVVRYQPSNDYFDDLKMLIQPQQGFVSLQVLKHDENQDPTRKRAARYLEVLECFSLVVEAAHSSTDLLSLLDREIKFLTDLLHDQSVNKQSSKSRDSIYSVSWDGRSYGCDNVPRLLIGCVGRLMQNPGIFSQTETFTEFFSECLHFLSHSSISPDQLSSGASQGKLLKALLKLDEVHNNQTLRDLIFDRLVETKGRISVTNLENLSLLRCLPLRSIKRSRVKQLGESIVQQLSNGTNSTRAHEVNDWLATLLHLNTLFPGSAIRVEDWRTWVDISQKLSIEAREVKAPTLFLTTKLLLRILTQLWSRAIAVQTPAVLSEVVSWLTDTVSSCKRLEYHLSPYLCLQSFFPQALNAESKLESIISTKKLQKLRTKFMRLLTSSLEHVSYNGLNDLADVWLILQAIVDIHDHDADEDLLQNIPNIQAVIDAGQSALGASASSLPVRPMLLSIQRGNRLIATAAEKDRDDTAIKNDLKILASTIGSKDQWSTEDIGLLAGQFDLTFRELSIQRQAHILEFLRTEPWQDLLAPIATAVIVLQVKTNEMTESPAMAAELAEVASISSLQGSHSNTELVLWLENSKWVLEKQALVVNQSTLDRLLAKLSELTSSAEKPGEKKQHLMRPPAADIYARICEILGVVLSRHRRRISDRYHLLVSVLHNLLRCLFWPGTTAIHDMPGKVAANTIITFGKALPGWLTDSEKALPATSAEMLARLFSSICNPTVSAARSSKKHAYNELNDETKKARQLAGQHMQYLIMSYARSSLDGQIDPLVKEQLMPGLYSIMDSIDRDLMRALNSGMDPSSRAIFKTLYDEYTRFGKWDKS